MNARDELYAVLRLAGEDRAEAERLIAAYRADSITKFETYPGELAMLRGLLGVIRVVAKHGDMNEVRRLLAEHASDEQAAYAEEKDTPTGATSTSAEQIVYRAAYEHESIPLGLYTTQAAARAHCEAQLSSEYPPHISVIHDWIGDDSDPLEPWELVAFIGGGEEQLTGYVVTPLTVATEYDPEAEG